MYEIARLRIGLADMPRPVMRRIEVPLAIHLDDLHLVFQQAMGWENRHPYEFRGGEDIAYGLVAPKRRYNRRRSASEATLADICRHLSRNLTFEYTYDFRDEWVHRVKLQGIGEADPERTYPFLLSATRRCPPEDCGGAWGYGRFLESISPQYRARQGIQPEDWEEDFDPNTVDEELIRLHFQRTAEMLAAKEERANRKRR